MAGLLALLRGGTAVSSAGPTGAPLPVVSNGISFSPGQAGKPQTSLDHMSPGWTWGVEVCSPGVAAIHLSAE